LAAMNQGSKELISSAKKSNNYQSRSTIGICKGILTAALALMALSEAHATTPTNVQAPANASSSKASSDNAALIELQAAIKEVQKELQDKAAKQELEDAAPNNPIDQAAKAAQTTQAVNALRQVAITGPGKVVLHDQITLELPLGFIYLPALQLNEFRKTEGLDPLEKNIVGRIESAGEATFVVDVRIFKDGYFSPKESDAKNWDTELVRQRLALEYGTDNSLVISDLSIAHEPGKVSFSFKGGVKDLVRETHQVILWRDGYVQLSGLEDASAPKGPSQELFNQLTQALGFAPGSLWNDFKSERDRKASATLGLSLFGSSVEKTAFAAVLESFDKTLAGSTASKSITDQYWPIGGLIGLLASVIWLARREKVNNIAISNLTEKLRSQTLTTSSSEVNALRYSFTFEAKLRTFIKLKLQGFLFTILTLGWYGATARVKNLKYLYSQVKLNNIPFEYNGDAKTIRKGGLIFLAVLVLSFVPVVGFVFKIVGMLLLPYGKYLALKFRAANTSFGGVVGKFNGSLSKTYNVFAVPVAIGLILLLLLNYLMAKFEPEGATVMGSFLAKQYILFAMAPTIILVLPLWHFLGRRLLFQNLSFGRLRFSFNAGWTEVLRLYLISIGPLVVIAGLLFVGEKPSEFRTVLAIIVSLLWPVAVIFGARTLQSKCWAATSVGAFKFETLKRSKAFTWRFYLWIFTVGITLGFSSLVYRFSTLKKKIDSLSILTNEPLETVLGREAFHSRKQANIVGEVKDIDLEIFG
jgi:uncharacterized membrane-anchored protein